VLKGRLTDASYFAEHVAVQMPSLATSRYLISFFFISLMAKTKKTGVTTAIQTRLNISVVSKLPNIRALVRDTV
jgi:hypothetical protein